MVAERLEKEVIQIFELIDDNRNFLLSGGAGSGKTYSLVSVINEIYNRNPIAKNCLYNVYECRCSWNWKSCFKQENKDFYNTWFFMG